MRHIMRCLPLAAALVLGLAVPVCAQDIEKDFEEFRQQKLQEFNEFKNKIDADFDAFLREAWQKFEAFEPIPVPARPEPPRPVVFDKNRPGSSPVAVVPGKVTEPARVPYVPVVVDIPEVKPDGRPVRRVSVLFYGTTFEVASEAVETLSLAGNKETDVADAWKEICGNPYEQLLKDCLTIKRDKGLSDWAYLLFIKQLGIQLYGAGHPDEVAFLQMFLMNKSGYKVRLAKIDNRLKLMVATNSVVYSTPYLTMDGDRYYVFEPVPNGSMGIYTYRRNFAEARNLVSLDISTLPDFAVQEQMRELASSNGQLKVRAAVNKNLIDFYRDYPQCDVVTHYKAPMSEELAASVYPVLRAAVAGKSQKDAANLLLNFVQTAFDYKTDGEQFGYEKPNFLDETFYYPYCDCEDRAMLYSTLVRELLGLDTVLLDYPNHIASAICFTEDVAGDYVLLDGGRKYLICDPTYIGAPIGMCMDRYKNVSPEIIR